MNPNWFGDSYDIVKKYFINILKSTGYEIYIDPMFTGDWDGKEKDFINFLGARLSTDIKDPLEKSALFIDPDTGIKEKTSPRHIDFNRIITEVEKYEIVFCFDQSFSRSLSNYEQIMEKLSIIIEHGVNGLYYDSHTKFLFTSKKRQSINSLKNELIRNGIPCKRLITLEKT
ncbi:MAG: hypothetical protein AVO38_04650 [delta proteobacterium ML8_D]|nr:MAG: hypothetical protein AVO38_04650 [delta proteobacterium ML8_D]